MGLHLSGKSIYLWIVGQIMEEAILLKPPVTGWARILIGQRPKRTLVRILFLVLGITLLSRYCVIPVEIQGASMEPRYLEGRWNLINGLAYAFDTPKRGDVVAARRRGQMVNGKGFLFLKRIIGLPGETVRGIGGRIYINGEALEEPYVRFLPSRRRERFTLQLEENQYFLIGDNRRVTGDGVFHIRQIVGRVLF